VPRGWLHCPPQKRRSEQRVPVGRRVGSHHHRRQSPNRGGFHHCSRVSMMKKNKIYFHCINLTNDKRHHGRGLTSGPYTSGSTCLIIQPKQTRHHEKQERCASHRGKCGVCRTPSKGFRGQKEEQESPQTQKRRKVQQENAQDLSQVICPVCAFSTHIFKN
jgi:hypothetical protein